MICPNCNLINSEQQCYVHNVITCLGCLYDGVKSFCDAPSFITQSSKFKAKKEADMNKLLDMIPRDNTWIPQ